MNDNVCACSESKEKYTPRLRERLRVAWKNWKVRKTAKAFQTLKKAIHDDPDYARTWHANIAMPIYDSGVNIHKANDVADHLMKHIFDVPFPKTKL